MHVRCGPPLTYPRVENPSPFLAGEVTERIWPCVGLQWEWLGGLPPLRKAAVVGGGSMGTAIASVLTRGRDGAPLADPPLVAALAADPVLASTRLIAEAWDAGGLYQVGAFPHYGRWMEWNGRYRDALRAFLVGREGTTGDVATRLVGSPDLYSGRGATASVNFVTCHDGFTLADWSSYDHKHNHLNGEDGHDGEDHNTSWNGGVEGPTDDPAVNALRARQKRNFLATLLLSQGVPMIAHGDELGRTQLGNNNTYCQEWVFAAARTMAVAG